MNIYAKAGHKVKAVHLDWGYTCDKETAKKYLEQDAIYVVEYTDVGGWHTNVKLEGISQLFNSVHFEDVTEA